MTAKLTPRPGFESEGRAAAVPYASDPTSLPVMTIKLEPRKCYTHSRRHGLWENSSELVLLRGWQLPAHGTKIVGRSALGGRRERGSEIRRPATRPSASWFCRAATSRSPSCSTVPSSGCTSADIRKAFTDDGTRRRVALARRGSRPRARGTALRALPDGTRRCRARDEMTMGPDPGNTAQKIVNCASSSARRAWSIPALGHTHDRDEHAVRSSLSVLWNSGPGDLRVFPSRRAALGLSPRMVFERRALRPCPRGRL